MGSVVTVTTHPFLSDAWIDAARELRERRAGELPPPPAAVKVNVVVTDIPHRDGDLQGHIDTSEGTTIIEDGHLDDAELTVTVDYATARAAFIDRDQQAVMQAFLGGKIFVEGDASKLLALQAGPPPDVEPIAEDVYAELRSFTADEP